LKAAAAAQGLTILTIGTDLDVPDTPCLLSGEEYPVQVCHVVPRALPSDLVRLFFPWFFNVLELSFLGRQVRACLEIRIRDLQSPHKYQSYSPCVLSWSHLALCSKVVQSAQHFITALTTLPSHFFPICMVWFGVEIFRRLKQYASLFTLSLSRVDVCAIAGKIQKKSVSRANVQICPLVPEETRLSNRS
jgi:hypothetical protein